MPSQEIICPNCGLKHLVPVQYCQCGYRFMPLRTFDMTRNHEVSTQLQSDEEEDKLPENWLGSFC